VKEVTEDDERRPIFSCFNYFGWMIQKMVVRASSGVEFPINHLTL
jgi:hypothetical protein